MAASWWSGAPRGSARRWPAHYADTGRETVLTGRDATRAAAVAAEIGGPARGLALDLAKPKTIRDALSSVGPVRYLAIVAIQRDDNTIRDFDIDRALELVTLKLVGFAEVVHVLLDRLSADSSIVLFGGQAKDRPYPGSTTVSTVNGGISGLARTLAWELAPIRVNAIHPGITGDSPYWHGKPPAILEGHTVQDHHQEARDDGRYRRRHAVPAGEPVGRGDRPRRRQRKDDVLSMAERGQRT